METCLGKIPADLLLFGRVVNVYAGDVAEAYVGVKNGKIAYVGKRPLPSVKQLKLKSKYILPAYIDGHVHIESSMMIPSQYARTVIPRGTCCVVADPHEIANVRGIDGITFFMKDSLRSPLRVYTMIPSCVPATQLETSGAVIGVKEVEELKKTEGVIGLGEVMNFPGVISYQEDVMGKIRSCDGMVIDGHAPRLMGSELCAYISAGISSDHESTTKEEAIEKLSLGMWIMIREGTLSKNLSELSSIVSPKNSRRFMLVTDDKHAEDLLMEGHIDHVLRRAVDEGIDPVDAVRMVTLNPAEYFGLKHLGGIAPNKFADMVIVDDLKAFHATCVIIGGKIVAENGKYTGKIKGTLPKNVAKKTMNFKKITSKDLSIKHPGVMEETAVRVIGVVKDQINTEEFECKLKKREKNVLPDPERDVLKVCVVERHKRTGRIGKGFVKGFGFKKGAVASSVAHDSHNIVTVGVSDYDMCTAVNRLKKINGGIVVCKDQILEELPLPVAGLMSTNSAEDVAKVMKRLRVKLAMLGCSLEKPFMTLSFLALPVIPKLRITDYGLVDVNRFKRVELFLE